MPDRPERAPAPAGIELRPVAPRGRSSAALATGLVGVAFVGLIVVGRFGSRAEPAPSAAPGPSVVAPVPSVAAPTSSIAPAPSVAPAPPVTPGVRRSAPDAFASTLLGYHVAPADSPGELVSTLSDGRTVAFVHSRTSLTGPGYGTIEVAVGTPDDPARVPGVSDRSRIYAGSPDLLYEAFIGLPDVRGARGRPGIVDGRGAWLVEASLATDGDERSFALLADGPRVFVITAQGFDGWTPEKTGEGRRHALADFLSRFGFEAPSSPR